MKITYILLVFSFTSCVIIQNHELNRISSTYDLSQKDSKRLLKNKNDSISIHIKNLENSKVPQQQIKRRLDSVVSGNYSLEELKTMLVLDLVFQGPYAELDRSKSLSNYHKANNVEDLRKIKNKADSIIRSLKIKPDSIASRKK